MTDPPCPAGPELEMCEQSWIMLGSNPADSLMMPPANLSLQLPPVFVHERQTVRMSDRSAEIWVKLPGDAECSVSVNFVEYPPEGSFRIFRTKLTTQEPRRFYLSAKRWDVKANRWIELVAVPTLSLSNDAVLGNYYVDLMPTQRVVVQFENPHAAWPFPVFAPSNERPPVPAAPDTAASAPVEQAPAPEPDPDFR